MISYGDMLDTIEKNTPQETTVAEKRGDVEQEKKKQEVNEPEKKEQEVDEPEDVI